MRANDFTNESAVDELKNKLPSLKNTSYDTIDELMQKISRRYKLTGKKLHDLFVHKYGHTPDTWIKKIKNRLSEENVEEAELDEACWTGYHKEGMKTMFGKRYPNCVKNKNESLETYVRKGECPGCGGAMVAEGQLNEKQDACYHKVKSRYKVWPSAYASGALVQCRKKGAANWGNKSNESITQEEYDQLDENLKKWFSDKWVRFGPDGKIKGPCARGDDSEGKPKCLPQSKAHNLGKKGRASAASRKRREDPNPERSGKAINVNTKKKSNEGVMEGGIATVGWPDDGNHTSNNPPVSIGGVSMKQLSVGDQVKYFGNKATVVGLSQDRKRARIHMPERHETQTIDTADLTRLGQGVPTRAQPGQQHAPLVNKEKSPSALPTPPLPTNQNSGNFTNRMTSGGGMGSQRLDRNLNPMKLPNT
jgi:hypothetical protein